MGKGLQVSISPAPWNSRTYNYKLIIFIKNIESYMYSNISPSKRTHFTCHFLLHISCSNKNYPKLEYDTKSDNFRTREKKKMEKEKCKNTPQQNGYKWWKKQLPRSYQHTRFYRSKISLFFSYLRVYIVLYFFFVKRKH